MSFQHHDSAALAIEARGLTKRFGDTQALDGVDLDVAPGTVLGVLGPNGAGKTTAVRVLSTLLKPDGGSARIGGYDVVADAPRVRRLIGLTGQYASVDEALSGTQNLVMIGRLLEFRATVNPATKLAAAERRVPAAGEAVVRPRPGLRCLDHRGREV